MNTVKVKILQYINSVGEIKHVGVRHFIHEIYNASADVSNKCYKI
jgi:hypothetical protein